MIVWYLMIIQVHAHGLHGRPNGFCKGNTNLFLLYFCPAGARKHEKDMQPK